MTWNKKEGAEEVDCLLRTLISSLNGYQQKGGINRAGQLRAGATQQDSLNLESVCLQCGRPGFDPWVGKIPWRRKWQSTPGLLPGKSHGQRSLVGYSLWGCKESDTTEWFTSLHFTDSKIRIVIYTVVFLVIVMHHPYETMKDLRKEASLSDEIYKKWWRRHQGMII